MMHEQHQPKQKKSVREQIHIARFGGVIVSVQLAQTMCSEDVRDSVLIFLRTDYLMRLGVKLK
jgi:hypothetical protein